MQERVWIEKLLRVVGLIGFVIGFAGLVVFIWGSISPGWFRCCNWVWGLRPFGLLLLADGFCGGLLFLGFAEVIGLLRTIAKK